MSKQVRFDTDKNELYFVQEDLTQEEKLQIWYTAQDIATFKKTTTSSSSSFCAHEQNNNNNGVDPTQRQTLRRTFVNSILFQQDEHKSLGIDDPKGLEKLSKTCSKASRRRAIDLALENTLAVLETDDLDEIEAIGGSISNILTSTINNNARLGASSLYGNLDSTAIISSMSPSLLQQRSGRKSKFHRSKFTQQ